MLTQGKVIQILKKKTPYLQREYGVKRLGVFGSMSKGSQMEGSDVDLFIEFNKFVGFKFISLSDYLERLFKRRVDILTPLGIKSIRVKHVADSIKENIVYV